MPVQTWETALDIRMLDLIATVIACCEGPREPGPGHPPAETVRVLATLRRFLREGTPWRSLKATEDMVSGSTLRRALARWAHTGLLAQVHALAGARPGRCTPGRCTPCSSPCCAVATRP